MKKWTTTDIPPQNNRRVLITGANSGIGLGTALELARKGAEIILAVRNIEKGKQAAQTIKTTVPDANIMIQALDLADLNSVQACIEAIKQRFDHIDVLINNAGIMMPKERMLSAQGYEIQLATNHFGHFAFTKGLLPLLEKSDDGRIVVVGSIITNMKIAQIYFDDLQFSKNYNPSKSYAQSKLANLMFLLDLATYLETNKSSVRAIGTHPGYTATNLQQHMGLLGTVMNALMAQPVHMGALPSLRAATDPQVKSGEYYGPVKFFGYRGYPERCKMTDVALDQPARKRLWQITEELTGVHY